MNLKPLLLFAGLFLALALGACVSVAPHPGASPAPAFAQNMTILFQGDSFTDGNRGRTADPTTLSATATFSSSPANTVRCSPS